MGFKDLPRGKSDKLKSSLEVSKELSPKTDKDCCPKQ